VAHGRSKWVDEQRAGIEWVGLDGRLIEQLAKSYPGLLVPRPDQSRRHPRIELDLPVRVHALGSAAIRCRTRDVSLSGAMLGLPADVQAPPGSHIRLEFEPIGTVEALVVRRSGAGIAVRFTGMDEATREQLIRHLYTMGLEQDTDVSAGIARLSTAILHRLVGAG
jgi:hypothetical protein